MTRHDWIARLRKQPSNSPFRKRGKRAQSGFRPFLEALEERYLLSGNYLVNSTDGGAASGTGNSGNLRYCIAGAESGGGGGTATFSSAALGNNPTITLSGGQVNITKSVTIQGLGASSLTISGGGLSRVFDITSKTATVNISSLTISGGSISGVGGGISNAGTLTLSDDAMSGNDAKYGGALFTAGGSTLIVQGSGLSGNSASQSGGGVFNSGTLTVSGGSVLFSDKATSGGAIRNDGTATISASTLSGNSAHNGGGIFSVGSLTVSSSSILSGNTASADGAGIFNTGTAMVGGSALKSNSALNGGAIFSGGGSVAVSASSILTKNSASYGGGVFDLSGSTLMVQSSTMSGNSASQSGGGVFNSGTLTVSGGSTLSDNRASYGGGIFNAGTSTVTGSTLSSNSASGLGGGIYGGGSVTVTNGSTLSGNSAKYGGGVFLARGKTLTVNSSTLSGNSASNTGGGVFSSGTVAINNSTLSGNSGANAGGGILNYGTLTVNNSTLYGNTGANGGGLLNYNSGTATLTNATIANNTATIRGGGIDVANGDVLLHNTLVAQNAIGSNPSDVQGSLDSTSNYNLIGDGSGGLTFNTSTNHNLGSSSANPLLSALGSYGGPTQTLALLPGSSAIDAGSSSYGGSTDQRGQSRPGTNNETDIGAFESQGFTITVTGGNNQSTGFDTAFTDSLVATVAAINSADGEPVAGGKITFTAPTTGASATFSVNPATIAADGTASVTTTANSYLGSYSVVASAAGIGQSASFNLTNSDGAIGPAPITNGQTPGSNPVNGRITGIAADSTNANIVYIASAGGGIWKTTDATDASPTWTPLTDNLKDSGGNPLPEFMGAVAETDATSGTFSGNQIVYAGMGEANNAIDNYYGDGILVSTNGGATWTLTAGPNEFSPALNATVPAFTLESVSKIVIDPSDPTGGTAYAAMADFASSSFPTGFAPQQTGIWKTTNFGATWTNTTATAPNNLSTFAPWSDVVIDPKTPTTLFAAQGNPSGSSGNGVYESTNGGGLWTYVGSLNLPGGSSVGRISLAISHPAAASDATLYASISQPSFNGAVLKLEKSTDSGVTWTDVTANLNGDNYLGSQGGYDNVIAISPTNTSMAFAAGDLLNQGPTTFSGEGIVETQDGGTTWTDGTHHPDINAGTAGNNGPHTDYHAMAFDANGRLLVGNDGGVWRLDSNDLTTPNIAWTNLNGNLNIIQFTGVAADTTVSNVVYGGSQDNGTDKYTGTTNWSNIFLGDGGIVRVDPTNSSRVYTERTGVSLALSTNGGSTFHFITSGISANRVNFYAPYVLDSSGGIYYGTDFLNFSSNQGSSWSPIGTPGTNNFNPNDDAIDAVAVSSVNNNVVYVAANDSPFNSASGGHMFVTKNAQTSHTWTQIDLPGGVGAGARNSIAVDPSDSTGGTAYAVVNAFPTSGTGKHVYKTTNFGSSWTDISGNLPNTPVDSVTVTPDGKIVYVGTDVGVYYTTNGGTSWSVLNSALPQAQVVDLEVVSSQNYLLIGTHGRGAWEVSLSSSGAPLLTQNLPPAGTTGPTSAGGGNPAPTAPGPDSVNSSTTSSNFSGSAIAAPSGTTPNSSPSPQQATDQVFSGLGQSWAMLLTGSNVQMLTKKDHNP